MARRKHVEKLTGLPSNSEPCVVLFGKEMEAWQHFKTAAQELLVATNVLKQATADRERLAAALLTADHDTLVDAQLEARKAVDRERERGEIFRHCSGVFRDAITKLATAAAPPG